MYSLFGCLSSLQYSARTRLSRLLRDRERGDVPGWVMVTVMTAILVVGIIGVFKGKIEEAISSSLDSVVNASNDGNE